MMLPYGYWTRRMRMRRSLQLVNCLASTLGLSQKLQQVFWFPNFQNTNIQIDSDTWFSNILFFVIVLISHHHQLAHPPPAAFSEVMQRPFLIKSHGCWNQTWTPCLVTGTGAQVSKRLMTVADVLCEVTRTRGVTEVTVIDHDLSPMLKEHPGPGEHFGWENVLQTCAHYMRSDEHAWMVTIVKFMIVEGWLDEQWWESPGDCSGSSATTLSLQRGPEEQGELLPPKACGYRAHGDALQPVWWCIQWLSFVAQVHQCICDLGGVEIQSKHNLIFVLNFNDVVSTLH